MGGFVSLFSDWIYGNQQASILILGLDASGKTTIMNRLKYGDNMVTVPTIGFNCEKIQYGSLSFIGWDILVLVQYCSNAVRVAPDRERSALCWSTADRTHRCARV